LYFARSPRQQLLLRIKDVYSSKKGLKPDELENNGAETWLTGIIEVPSIPLSSEYGA